MKKDTFILLVLLISVAIAEEEDAYQKFSSYQTNVTVDAFSAYKQDDEIKIAIASRVQDSYTIRIFQLDVQESKENIQHKQTFDAIKAQDIIVRFFEQGEYLLVAINHKEIRIYQQTEESDKTQHYLLKQTIQLQQEIKAINVCQKHSLFAISINKKIQFYQQDNDIFAPISSFTFNQDITTISISSKKNWVSASNGRVVYVLQIKQHNDLELFSTIHMEEDFSIDQTITIDETSEVFMLHEHVAQQKSEGRIKIFGQNSTNRHQFIPKQTFNNFTDFPRSMSVSENGKLLAFFTQKNRIWTFQRNQGTKMRCTYCLRQSFNVSQSNLNHLLTTSDGDYLILTDESGEITVYKFTQMEGKSSIFLIVFIVVVAVGIIGFLIYYYKKKKQTNEDKQQKQQKYTELKETPKF